MKEALKSGLGCHKRSPLGDVEKITCTVSEKDRYR